MVFSSSETAQLAERLTLKVQYEIQGVLHTSHKNEACEWFLDRRRKEGLQEFVEELVKFQVLQSYLSVLVLTRSLTSV